MKKITFFRFFMSIVCLVLLTTSCQNTKEVTKEEAIQELKANLIKDSDFVLLMKMNKDFRQKVAIDYYNFHSRNKELINANEDKLADRAKAKAIYESAGMEHVEEYLN